MVKSSTCKGREGFSLLEMGIVLLIIASIVGGGLVIFIDSLDKDRWKLTQSRMQIISSTLAQYRHAYNRIPCPGDLTMLTSAANFGTEAANPATCTGGAPAANFINTPAAYSVVTNAATTNGSMLVTMPSIAGIFVGSAVSGTGIAGSTTVVAVSAETTTSSAAIVLSANATATGTPTLTFSFARNYAAGAVPTNTLQLPDDVAFDGWGRRMVYAVETSATATDSFISIPITDGLISRITISDTSAVPQTITTGALYALISYGQNGHGAYPRSSVVRVNASSSDANELINCHCTHLAVDDASAYSHFAAGMIGATYDDIVTYATRAQLSGPKE